MHVAIDLTNSPHVPFFAPLVRELERRGARVTITARQFAQTVELAELHGLSVNVIGHHGGASRLGKARAAIARSFGLYRFLRAQRSSQRIDVAMSHGSTDLPVACRLLGVPHVTIFDYEWATTMHRLNCRLSQRVVTPDSIPAERLAQYGATRKLVQYPGLKEEYYVRPSANPAAARTALGVDVNAILVVLRPPPELALYHRGHTNTVFDDLLHRLAHVHGATTVVLPRTSGQKDALASRLATEIDAGSFLIPDHAVDAASLLTSADLMISAGGTMNREAVALGVPVYTVFAGRMGAVDEHLIATHRLHQLTNAADVVIERRDSRPVAATERNPNDLLGVLLGNGLAADWDQFWRAMPANSGSAP